MGEKWYVEDSLHLTIICIRSVIDQETLANRFWVWHTFANTDISATLFRGLLSHFV